MYCVDLSQINTFIGLLLKGIDNKEFSLSHLNEHYFEKLDLTTSGLSGVSVYKITSK